ncbi:MAG: hypothetical protein ABIN55_14090 [Aeromicrobium sp.]
MNDSTLRVTSAITWLAGGMLWAAAGLVDGGSVELLWIPADLLLLAGLVTIGQLGLHGRTRTGRAGLAVAGAGRVTFLIAEILSAIQDKEQNVLLPAAAMLSAVGMTVYGVSILRASRWTAPGRYAPLACGLYPFAVMFPIVAASGGDPSETAIAFWGATFAVLGATLSWERHSPSTTSPRHQVLSA